MGRLARWVSDLYSENKSQINLSPFSFYLPDLSIVGMDVVELHLKRRVLLDEDNGFDASVLKGFVVADIEYCYYGEGYCD